MPLGNFVTSEITNATKQELITDDNTLWGYQIKAIDGYVLHDKELDFCPGINEETGDMLPDIEGYTEGLIHVFRTYDFVANPRNLYTRPKSEVPDNQIFGGGGNDHEIA